VAFHASAIRYYRELTSVDFGLEWDGAIEAVLVWSALTVGSLHGENLVGIRRSEVIDYLATSCNIKSDSSWT
jgi:hypothetical protein